MNSSSGKFENAGSLENVSRRSKGLLIKLFKVLQIIDTSQIKKIEILSDLAYKLVSTNHWIKK